MTREQAINYLFSRGFTNEQVGEVVRALTYEPATKNDLGIDCISRADVNRLICEYRDDATETGNERDLERAYGANAVGELISELPSVTPQEPQIFKWCANCKEYDQEKHCCHRWSKVIRDTVEEMKQEQEPRKGHWLHRPHVYGVTYCSICDFELKINNTNYCPNCGAKMESEADNGNDD